MEEKEKEQTEIIDEKLSRKEKSKIEKLEEELAKAKKEAEEWKNKYTWLMLILKTLRNFMIKNMPK